MNLEAVRAALPAESLPTRSGMNTDEDSTNCHGAGNGIHNVPEEAEHLQQQQGGLLSADAGEKDARSKEEKEERRRLMIKQMQEESPFFAPWKVGRYVSRMSK